MTGLVAGIGLSPCGISKPRDQAANLQAFGGKIQYVKWAWEEGIDLSSSKAS